MKNTEKIWKWKMFKICAGNNNIDVIKNPGKKLESSKKRAIRLIKKIRELIQKKQFRTARMDSYRLECTLYDCENLWEYKKDEERLNNRQKKNVKNAKAKGTSRT